MSQLTCYSYCNRNNAVLVSEEICLLLFLVQEKLEDTCKRASELVQWGEGLAAKPDNASSIPGTHIVGGDNSVL